MTTERLSATSELDPAFRSPRRLVSLRRRQTDLRSVTSPTWEPRVYQGGPDGHAALDLDVRPARMLDLLQVARMPRIFRLKQPDLSLHGYSRTASVIRSVLPLGKMRPKVFVAATGDRVVGFIQCQPANPDQRWHVIALGTATGVYDASPVEDALIRYGVTAAGLRGVKRIYARVLSGSELLESFERVAFTPYATETVFACDSFVNGGGRAEIRAQESSDTWAIHQLHNATVPRQVQYAEAFTSHRWDVDGRDELGRSTRRLGWIVDDGHGITAYARVTCAGDDHLVELLYQPERREVLGALLDTVVNRLRGQAKIGRLYCALRGYQVEAAKVLEQRGFDPILEQDLLVKYTTATARAPQPEPAAVHAEVIERLPKRVPSFLNRKASDEAAG